MLENKNISICILAYNNQSIIEATLLSIQKNILPYVDCNVYLLDNGSFDKTFEIAQSFKFLKIYRVQQNLYFSGGANYLFDICRSRHVFFMSSDVTPNADALTKIIEYAEGDNMAGIIGCGSRLRSGELESNTKRFTDPLWLHCLHGLFGVISPLYKKKLEWYLYSREKASFQKQQEIDVVQDSFIWINGHLLTRGLRYDTQLRLYYTEDDICSQVRGMGYKVIYFKDAEVQHISQATANQRKKEINAIYVDDSLRFCYKHYGFLHWFLLKCDVAAMNIMRKILKRLDD